jgi:molecular chaperone DnaK
MGITVGIDLGTTNSGVAVLEGGRPRMILNDAGANITPSAVWQQPTGEICVGGVAYKKAGSARRFKRMMGSDSVLRVGDADLAPEEASSLILRKLVEDAEKVLRQTVDAAVITVPANWKDGPRRATEAAGRLAGLRVERLINEPTAAAMAYGLRDDADGKTIAVYDLGGGTFDVTILRIQQKVFDIVTSSGDDMLGGTDFDLKLQALVLERLTSRTGYAPPAWDAADDKMRQRLRDLEMACEEAKMELSFAATTTIVVPFLDLWNGEPLSVEEEVSRADFEKLIEDDVARTIGYMESALRTAKAKMPREAIDEVLLVGGSSRIPLVRQRVAELFDKEPLTGAVNPDEAIALGAAIQAGIIGQEEVSDDSFVVTDIVNNSLGIEAVTLLNDRPMPDTFVVHIQKGAKVPGSGAGRYTPLADGQTSVLLRCFEGEFPFTAGNILLDEIPVSGLPERPAVENKIDVTFTKTPDDMLEVNWTVEGTDIRGTHTIRMRSGLHDDDELARRRSTLDAMWIGGRASGSSTPAAAPPPPEAPPQQDWRTAPLAARYRALIDRAEATLAGDRPFDSRADLETAVADLKAEIIANDAESCEALDLTITDILFDLE